MFVWEGFTFVPGRLDIEKLIKPPMIYSVSYFHLGGLVLCLGGISPPIPPWRRDCVIHRGFTTKKSYKTLPTNADKNKNFISELISSNSQLLEE